MREHHGARSGREDRPVLTVPRLRLTLLAPDIVEAILDGRQPERTTLPALMTPFQWTGKSNQVVSRLHERHGPAYHPARGICISVVT